MSRFHFPESAGDLIGAHLSTKGGAHTVFERAAIVKAAAVALFSKNSNQWKGKVLTEEDCALFHQKRSVDPVLTHASYLINLATINPQFLEKSIAALADELDRAERLGIHAVVLHPGAHMGEGARAGIDQIARSFDKIHAMLPSHKVVTLLETSAGQGSCVGSTFEELGRIRALVDDKARLGICVDTCHIFAAGYDIRSRNAYARMVDEIEEHVGLANVGAFHLNDSKKPLASRVDRHEHIGKGEIGTEAFAMLLNDSRFARLPKLIETPKNSDHSWDVSNITLLRSLLGSGDARHVLHSARHERRKTRKTDRGNSHRLPERQAGRS
jgi:deoxyribonuclease-4